MGDNKKNKIVKIDRSKCVGCGLCQSMCPEGFEMVDGLATTKDANVECVEQAAKSCPVGAIILE